MAASDDRLNDILYRFQELMTVQYNWLPQWQEKADYVCPQKNSIMVNRIPGYKRTLRLFESSAIHAMNLFASAIHGTLTPSFTKWFKIGFDEPKLNEVAANRNWLDLVNERVRKTVNASNFASEGHQVYIDLATFGTACIFEDERKDQGWWGGLQFKSVPISKYALAEGSDGKVDTLFRDIWMSAHAIHAKWPDTTPEEINWEEHPDRLYEVIHAVEPTGFRDELAYKWKSTYILYQQRELLSEKGFYNFPFMVPRWQTYSDETYGTAVTDNALPDIRSLNKIVELELRNLGKNVDPPLGSVQGEVIGPARMIPGGMTMVKSKDALFPIDTAGNYQVVNLKKTELIERINGIYMIDQLQLQTGPQMTATEVNVRYETMMRILGPYLGRLENEWLIPLLSRTFNLMYRAGLFNPLPPALTQKLQGQPVGLKVEYEGPMARAQRSSDLTAIQSFLQTVEPMAKFDQNVLDNIDFDEIAREAADITGIPSNAIRDKDQTEQIRQAKQQQMEEQQQGEQAGQAAEATKNVTPLIRQAHQRPQSGSIADHVMKQMAG